MFNEVYACLLTATWLILHHTHLYLRTQYFFNNMYWRKIKSIWIKLLPAAKHAGRFLQPQHYLAQDSVPPGKVQGWPGYWHGTRLKNRGPVGSPSLTAGWMCWSSELCEALGSLLPTGTHRRCQCWSVLRVWKVNVHQRALQNQCSPSVVQTGALERWRPCNTSGKPHRHCALLWQTRRSLSTGQQTCWQSPGKPNTNCKVTVYLLSFHMGVGNNLTSTSSDFLYNENILLFI